MKKSVQISFIAAVNDEFTSRIEEVAERLRDKGCEIKKIMPLTGVITGNVDQSIPLKDLRVEGIDSVDRQKKVRKI